MTDIVERLRAERIVAAIKEMQGKRLEVAFQSDETAHLVTSIIENAGKVARAYLEAADAAEGLRDAALEEAAAICQRYAQGGQSKPDKIHAAYELASRIRLRKKPVEP